MKKRWIIGLFLVLVLAVASFVLVRYRQEREYLSSHVFLGEDVYPMDARQIDLRGRDVTMEYHSQLQALLPACEILWDVPFQGGKVSWDVTDLTVTALNEADLYVLTTQFPKLNHIHEGVAVMHHEGVDVSITGNSTNPTRFQHPVAGTYKKEFIDQGKKYFSVTSGGGTGRTLHPDNMAAGPASYGMTDTMGRMHSDAQFAGSSSVPAHVEMMGFLGAGNNPMVGMTVSVAVAVEESLK